MFNLSTKEVVLSIANAPVIREKQFVYQHYNNFFGNSDIAEGNFGNLKFEKLENQEKYPRQRLSYNEKFSKQLQIFFMNRAITSALEEQYKTKLKFDSVDLWIDNKNYFLKPHVDNNSIKLSLQIYLGEDQPGTCLFENQQDKDPLYVFNFKNNCGYSMLLDDSSYHGLEYPVKRDGRTSLYVRYN